MSDLEFLEKTDFSFEITGDAGRIEILPYIDAESDRSRTLIASFKVDSMEMIESARIPLRPGKNHIPFQQSVLIVKPLLWEPGSIPFLYHFTVVFHQAGAPVHSIDKNAGIRFVEADPGRSFRINGHDLELIPVEPDFTSDGRNLNGNLVRLKDSDPDLVMKLDRCSEWGLVGALELTGAADPGIYAGNPGICFYTAPSGSAGEQMARSIADVPFLSDDDLNSLLNRI